jgi:hypothetical protein
MLDQILERWNLRRAFERVEESSGCQGADGMTVGHFAADLERELDRLQDRFLRRCYQPYPLLQIVVPKRSGALRLNIAMLIVVSYDVREDRRRTRLAHALLTSWSSRQENIMPGPGCRF